MSDERWLSVRGYEGYYEVSDQGRVRSVDRLVPHARNGPTNYRGRPLTIAQNLAGYPQVTVSREHKAKTLMVHSLVAQAFVEGESDGLEVLHWDDVKTNNVWTNLRWGTRSENLLDRVRLGTHHNSVKTHCKRGHEFTEENTILKSNGARGCRTCTRDRDRENMRKVRARRRSQSGEQSAAA